MFSADITGQIHASPLNLHVCVITSLYFNNNISFPLQKIWFLGIQGRICILVYLNTKKGGTATHALFYMPCSNVVIKITDTLHHMYQGSQAKAWIHFNLFTGSSEWDVIPVKLWISSHEAAQSEPIFKTLGSQQLECFKSIHLF